MFARYTQDRDVTRYMTWRPHTSVRQTQTFLRRLLAGRGTSLAWVLAAPDDDHPFGVIELRPSGHRAEIGYVLARAWWGRGLMTEATRAVVEWGLSRPGTYRVWAVTDVDNAASGRVLEKAGLTREGLLRRWIIHPNLDAEPRDCWCYARVR